MTGVIPISELKRLSIACILLSMWAASATDPSTDRGILEIFYFACNGENWNDKTHWIDGNMSICDWQGVDCTYDGGEQVQKLMLTNNNVSCTLPNELFYLSELEWLDLRTNEGITVDFSTLNASAVSKKLQYLILSDTSANSLQGIQVFSDSLNTLYMVGCELSGPFPESVLQLSALQHLDVAYNFLSGAFPDGSSNLMDLRTLGIAHNFFNGQIPSTIGNLQRLTQFQGQFNAFSGTLPTEMGDMFSLSFLTLNNQIQGVGDARVGGIAGPLLDFATLQFLFHIDLSNNLLSGPLLPNFLESLSLGFADSTIIDLRSNRLSGEVPASLARFDTFSAYLADNLIESVPDVLCQESDWLFGQVGEFGCNGFLCPPGTFNPFGRQTSDGFPCWQCSTGESAPYFGSQRCSNDAILTSSDKANTTLSLIDVTSPLERLSKDASLTEATTPTTSDFEGTFWRDGLEQDTSSALVVQQSAVSSGGRTAEAMGTLAVLVVSTMLMLPECCDFT